MAQTPRTPIGVLPKTSSMTFTSGARQITHRAQDKSTSGVSLSGTRQQITQPALTISEIAAYGVANLSTTDVIPAGLNLFDANPFFGDSLTEGGGGYPSIVLAITLMDLGEWNTGSVEVNVVDENQRERMKRTITLQKRDSQDGGVISISDFLLNDIDCRGLLVQVTLTVDGSKQRQSKVLEINQTAYCLFGPFFEPQPLGEIRSLAAALQASRTPIRTVIAEEVEEQVITVNERSINRGTSRITQRSASLEYGGDCRVAYDVLARDDMPIALTKETSCVVGDATTVTTDSIVFRSLAVRTDVRTPPSGAVARSNQKIISDAGQLCAMRFALAIRAGYPGMVAGLRCKIDS